MSRDDEHPDHDDASGATRERAGADLDADEGEPEIEPFATGGEPSTGDRQHGYGYE